jgi:uncharacterized membrane protein
MNNTKIENLFEEEKNHLDKLQSIVEESIKEEKLIVQNLLHPPKETLTKGQAISDKVAAFGGSWKFIIIFGIVLFIWILFNVVVLTNLRFDPYPFILMNLILSCIAALQAPIIMMSQNRKEEKDRLRAENDYMINLKAEMEIRRLHEKIDLLLQEEIKTLYKSQAEQLEILKSIEAKIK